MNFVAIDVETAVGKRWSICQIGLAFVENGEIIHTISKFVRPPMNEYSPMNIKVHGILPERTEKKPEFPQIWEELYPLIEGKKLVAHNASFDINCLQQTLDFYNLPIPNFECDCTFKLTGQPLDNICCAFNIDLTNHHDATTDAIACAKVYLNLLKGIKPDYSISNPRTTKESGFSMPEGHERLCGDVLKPDLENADSKNPFYAKKVVFTGVLNSIKRKDAADVVKKLGADIDTSITFRTDFVITGSAPGPSKMKKIQQFNSQGSNIQIVGEDEFLKMIK